MSAAAAHALNIASHIDLNSNNIPAYSVLSTAQFSNPNMFTSCLIETASERVKAFEYRLDYSQLGRRSAASHRHISIWQEMDSTSDQIIRSDEIFCLAYWYCVNSGLRLWASTERVIQIVWLRFSCSFLFQYFMFLDFAFGLQIRCIVEYGVLNPQSV